MFKLIRKSPRETQGKFHIIQSKSNSAFSFFNFIFLSNEALNDKDYLDVVIDHEQIHSRQLHSGDILLFEIIGIFFWFNPIIYAYKKAIKLQHEFIADNITSSIKPKAEYETFLIKYSLKSLDNSLFHGFAYHPIEKRIHMLNQTQTSIMKRLRLLLSLPLVILLLFGFNISAQTQEEAKKKMQIIIETTNASSQQVENVAGKISGKVVNDNGEILTKVTVTSLPSGTKATTDEKGLYSIKPSEKDEKLVFEIKGYKKMEIGNSKVNILKFSTLNVQLKKD